MSSSRRAVLGAMMGMALAMGAQAGVVPEEERESVPPAPEEVPEPPPAAPPPGEEETRRERSQRSHRAWTYRRQLSAKKQRAAEPVDRRKTMAKARWGER